MTTPTPGVVQLGSDTLCYYGAAGTTAATPFQPNGKVSVGAEFSEFDTTDVGDTDETSVPTTSKRQISFDMIARLADTTFQTLYHAAMSKTAQALKVSFGGGFGVDWDFYLTVANMDIPAKEGQKVSFTAKPTKEWRAKTLTGPTGYSFGGLAPRPGTVELPKLAPSNVSSDAAPSNVSSDAAPSNVSSDATDAKPTSGVDPRLPA